MGERDSLAVELECAHCGDLVMVQTATAEASSCSSCGEPIDLPRVLEPDELAEKKDTARVPRMRRRG